MKFKITFLLLICVGAFTSQAQDYHLGLRLGYSQSSLNSDETPALSLKDRQAFTFAFSHNVRFRDSRLGLAIETGYVLKGARVNDVNNDYRLHYINFPVLLDVYVTEKLKLSVGPEVAFLADARNRTSDSTSVTLKSVFDNRWEISGTFGFSYALDYFVDIGARYSTSFTKYGNQDAILNRRDQYNNYFQIFFAFKVAN